MNARRQKGFTLIEVTFASGIAAIAFLSTISLLLYSKALNEREQERTRAHQIICEQLEVNSSDPASFLSSEAEQTIWDHGTPDDPADDTRGNLEVIVKDMKTGATLAPGTPATENMLRIEATLSWHPHPRFRDSMLRETVVTYRVP